MQVMKVSSLIPHPQNNEFFDDMSGGKWKEFLESVKTSGIIEPIVVTEKNVIVSGHQRVRACKELGITEILCEVRQYNGDDGKVVKDLIETNVRQRGTIGGTDEQIRKRVDALKRYYGIKNGGDKSRMARGHSGDDVEGDVSSLKEVCERAGTTINVYHKAQRLAKAIPEVKELIESGVVSPKTARSLILRLSESEQRELLAALPTAQKLTQSEVQTYIDQLHSKDAEIADRDAKIASLRADQEKDKAEIANLQAEAADAVKALKGVEMSEDAERYLDMQRKMKEAQEQYRKEHEAHDQLKTNSQRVNAQAMEQIRKLQDEVDELRIKANAKQQVIEHEKEVPPADYEELKRKAAFYDAHFDEMNRNRERVEPIAPRDIDQAEFDKQLVAASAAAHTEFALLTHHPERIRGVSERTIKDSTTPLQEIVQYVQNILDIWESINTIDKSEQKVA